ncbi:MAG: MOSC domain-containing protein [Acidobacteria bacterium]|nr:MOSC domain-containing protein [Acidobacteriota bacterium]
MTTKGVVGTVAALWRFPVKSMAGEQVDQVDITAQGIVGDRAYALVDSVSGKVVSAKSLKLFPGILDCRASFVETPWLDHPVPPVRIVLPNGDTVTSGTSEADRALSAHFGREVTLAKAAPPDFTIDQYHPDIEDADPAGYRDTVVEARLGAAFFAEVGQPSPVPAGAFFDLFPASVMTTSTLKKLGALHKEGRFDPRRFRMNVIVATEATGFVENEWVGRELAVGDAVRLKVTMPDPRCVMTTLAQDDLPDDTDVLRTLVRYNRLQVGTAGRFPCAGVYAVIDAPGTLRVGDPVTLA